MKFDFKEFDKAMAKSGNDIHEIIKNICGQKIGDGQFRDVYLLKQNPKFVVKVERDMSLAMFCNATEWRNCINNQHWDLIKDWLAPCELITQTGQMLIQERVYWDGKKRKDYPTHVPAVFTDLKLQNFGWTEKGNFVCCDYSFLLTPMSEKQYRRARWTGTIKHL